MAHGTPTPRRRGEVVDGKRFCARCKEDKPLSEWGQANCCKACNCANARAYRKPAATTLSPCVTCGAMFAATKRQTRTCSEKCRRAYKVAQDKQYQQENLARTRLHKRRWADANRDKLAEKQRRREARKRGATVGPIDLEALWTGACGICGDALDAARRYPDPASRSLDHIVPLALGGSHTQDNLQWSHLSCNVRKGVRVAEAVAS